MAKVAKNLRRLRTDCGMTQAQLAEKMHVTRQAISNWENDKTQPDIDALVRLSEILNTEIEALIYGKRRHIGTDEQRPDYRIRIVLAVLGTLFVGIGLVLIFFNFWRDFPLGLQAVFSVLPILLGQGFAVYVFLRQRKSVLFRECAAILWCVGVVSTVVLVNSVFDIHCGFTNCLLLDIVFCLPVLWLFQAVSPLAPYLYMVIHWSIQANTVEFLFALLLLAGGLLLPLVLRKDKADARYKFSVWIATLGAAAFYAAKIMVEALVTDPYGNPFYIPLLLFPVFAGFLLLDRGLDFTKPFAPLGLFGGTICSALFSIIEWSSIQPYFYAWSEGSLLSQLTNTEAYKPVFPSFGDAPWIYISIMLVCVFIGLCVFLRRDDLEDEILKILQAAFLLGSYLLGVFGILFSAENFLLFMILTAIGFGIVLLLSGAQTMRLAYVNLGMILLFIQCIGILQIFSQNILIVGLGFLAFGALLIGINIKMALDKKEALAMEALTEQAGSKGLGKNEANSEKEGEA